MFVNWVFFLFNEIWKQKVAKMEETLMIVDGHVGKVFCRTGMLEEVLYEKRRPYIIQASKMRPLIEEIVSKFGKIPFYVDNGAFYLFEDGYCTELRPNCKGCPVNNVCKKYLKWTAYQIDMPATSITADIRLASLRSNSSPLAWNFVCPPTVI